MRSVIFASALFAAACAHQKASEEPVAQPAPEHETTTVPDESQDEPAPPQEPVQAEPEAAAAPPPELGSTKYCGKFTPPNTRPMQTADLRKKQKCAAAKASAKQEGLLDNRDATCQASLEGTQTVCVEFSGKAWSLWDATYPALRKVAECHCAPK